MRSSDDCRLLGRTPSDADAAVKVGTSADVVADVDVKHAADGAEAVELAPAVEADAQRDGGYVVVVMAPDRAPNDEKVHSLHLCNLSAKMPEKKCLKIAEIAEQLVDANCHSETNR